MQTLTDLNFRDLGGIVTADGRRIRPKMLFRSQSPAHFIGAHKTEFAALGLRLICDLRSAGERSANPHDLSGDVHYFNFDMHHAPQAEGFKGWKMLQQDGSAQGAHHVMKGLYADMPSAIHELLAPLIVAMNADGLPALIHCTAGKDRTGVLVALLLLALGVDRDEVLADYMRSEIFARNSRADPNLMAASEKMFGFAPSEASVHALINVDPDYLEAALEAIDSGWGGLENYFRSAGVTREMRATLAQKVVSREPDATGS